MDRSLANFAGRRVRVLAFRWFSKVILLGSAAGVAAACSSDEATPTAGLAAACQLNSECSEGLVCGLGKCHLACKTSADCTGGACVQANGVNVCRLPSEDCVRNGQCPAPLVCAVDSKCRNQCTDDRDCLYGQKCAASGVCAESTEVDQSGNIVGADGGPGSGGRSNGGGGAGGSGGASGAGGNVDAGSGGTLSSGGGPDASATGGSGGGPDASATGGAVGTGGSSTGGVTGTGGASSGGAAGAGGSDSGPVCSNGTGGSGPTPPQCTAAGNGISISGLVVYNGSRTGRLYVMAADANGGGSDNLIAGTSMALTGSSPYTFVIQGVPRTNMSLLLSAYIDTGNDGQPHTSSDPIGTALANLGTSSLGGVTINLNDPPATPATPPQANLQFSAINGGAFAFVQVPTNSNGHLLADKTRVYWGTSPGVSPSQNIGSVDALSDFAFVSGLTNGTPYYFVASHFAGTVQGPLSAETQVTPVAPVGGHSVSGNVLFSCQGLTAASTVTVVLASDNGPGVFSMAPTRTSPQAYVVNGAPDGFYNLIATIDVDGNSFFGAGDESTGFETGGPLVQVAGSDVTGPDITVPATDALTTVVTQNNASNGYELKFVVESNRKRVVSASVCSGPRMATPSDLSLRRFTSSGQFRGSFGIGSTPPSTSDVFGISLVYSDGTTGVVGAQVSGVFPDSPVLVSPTGATGSTPTFSWTLPSGLPAKYWQQISVNPQMGGSDLWRATLGPGVATVMYNADGRASQPTLPAGNYSWNVDIGDDKGNSASAGASFSVP